jgi:hypothetical protein
MKNLFTLIGLLLALNYTFAQTSGGPDTYGYIWRDSNDPNGPTYSWLNIQDIGIQVTGLTDDNASAPISMGMDFHYYWYDVNQIVIGSNGWLSFDNVSNIANCFPTIPAAGGASDNYLAPFMTDLIMNAAGTAAEVYYWFDSSNDRFVVSYLDVPWWQQAAPGYVGLNSFQVILSVADSSITFQYKDMDQASLLDNAGCASDLIVGMENITGNIGLGLSQFTEVVPSDNYAIKFYPPAVALINIPDVTALWNDNEENKGVFIQSGVDYNLSSQIKNVGNVDISTNINVNTEVESLGFVQAFTSSDDIAGLQSGVEAGVSYQLPINLGPGQYYFNVLTTNSSDINPGNNSRTTEINAVDVSAPDVLFSYATQNLPDGNVGWTGGGGMGIYIEPPVYPATLNAVDVYLASGINGASEFTIEVIAPDGADGLPGTSLETVVVGANTYVADQWVNVPLNSPVVVSSGGIYIAFKHGADGVFLGTETTGPKSRQNFEFVGGSWATYRENTNVDLLINGHFSFPVGVGVNEVAEENRIELYPNPSNGLFNVSGLGKESWKLRVYDAVGRMVMEENLAGQANNSVDLTKYGTGLYFLHFVGDSANSTLKVLVK